MSNADTRRIRLPLLPVNIAEPLPNGLTDSGDVPLQIRHMGDGKLLREMKFNDVFNRHMVVVGRVCIGLRHLLLERPDQETWKLNREGLTARQIIKCRKPCDFDHSSYHNLRWWHHATTLAWNATVQTVAEMFGVTLRRSRHSRGMSQEALAEATGLSTNFIGEMERGLKAPGLGVIVRLAIALDVSVPDLLVDFTDSAVRRLKT